MDIINIFQEITKKYIENTQDAGNNMRNVYVKDYIVQCYIDDSYHNVWILEHDENGFEKVSTICDYSDENKLFLLEDFYKTITNGYENANKNFSSIIMGVVAGGVEMGKIFYMDKEKREEYIQAEIMNWSVEDMTKFMQLLGRWDENTILVSYSPDEVGRLVQMGIELGWDVDVEIERGRDYFLFAKEEKQNAYYSIYKIVGHIDEFDEIAGILDIWGLVGSIMTNNDYMKKFLDFAKIVRSKSSK